MYVVIAFCVRRLFRERIRHQRLQNCPSTTFNVIATLTTTCTTENECVEEAQSQVRFPPSFLLLKVNNQISFFFIGLNDQYHYSNRQTSSSMITTSTYLKTSHNFSPSTSPHRKLKKKTLDSSST